MPNTPPRSSSARAAELVARFAARPSQEGTSVATVRDFCDSADHLPEVTALDGDLKNVQRPWAIKTILAASPPPARVLEIGGGEPIVSGLLADLGYDATLVDPYDGSGRGPREFEEYRARFPQVKLVRDYFAAGIQSLPHRSYDVIFSVSVLEHIPVEPLASCFEAIAEHLVPNGWSIHCVDFIVGGVGAEHDIAQAERFFEHQARLAHKPAPALPAIISELRSDVETFFLSPQGHHSWRGGRPYDEFPFRQVVSLQSVIRRTGARGEMGPR